MLAIGVLSKEKPLSDLIEGLSQLDLWVQTMYQYSNCRKSEAVIKNKINALYNQLQLLTFEKILKEPSVFNIKSDMFEGDYAQLNNYRQQLRDLTVYRLVDYAYDECEYSFWALYWQIASQQECALRDLMGLWLWPIKIFRLTGKLRNEDEAIIGLLYKHIKGWIDTPQKQYAKEKVHLLQTKPSSFLDAALFAPLHLNLREQGFYLGAVMQRVNNLTALNENLDGLLFINHINYLFIHNRVLFDLFFPLFIVSEPFGLSWPKDLLVHFLSTLINLKDWQKKLFSYRFPQYQYIYFTN